jgi:hypothetical protein
MIEVKIHIKYDDRHGKLTASATLQVHYPSKEKHLQVRHQSKKNTECYYQQGLHPSVVNAKCYQVLASSSIDGSEPIQNDFSPISFKTDNIIKFITELYIIY